MGTITYRGNLKAASFPLMSELFGRSIIVKGPDQNAPIGKVETGTTDTTSQGEPQIYYCHNVLPADSGYKSVGYTQAAAAAGTNFVKVITVRDASGASAQLAVTADGNLFVMEYGTNVWVSPTSVPTPASIAGRRMTTGYVSGISYIFFAGYACFSYNFTLNAMLTETLTFDSPTVQADMIGVSSNKGYLIAYSTDSVYWSSLVDPTDFVASLATGAGGGQLEGARGIIVTVEFVYGGLICFTNANAVAAIASDNTRFPYNFVEIVNAGGLLDPEFVSYDANTGSLYAYTTAGMQLIKTNGAAVVFPDVTDYLAGSLIETFNEITNVLETQDGGASPFTKRVAMIAGRYLVISYGINTLTDALVYDTGYKQWGRLKVPHVDCFELDRPSIDTPKKSICFCQSDGKLLIVDTDINSANSNGVMLIGKFQYVRARLLQLQAVEFENVNQGAAFTMLDLPSLDGKNFSPAITGFLQLSAGKMRQYLFHNTALNHTLVLKGSWNAVGVVMKFNISGSR
jgi:hypothetical protein